MNQKFRALIDTIHGESARRPNQHYTDLAIFSRSDDDEVPVRCVRIRLARDGDHVTVGRWVRNGEGWRQRQTPIVFRRDEIPTLIRALEAAHKRIKERADKGAGR